MNQHVWKLYAATDGCYLFSLVVTRDIIANCEIPRATRKIVVLKMQFWLLLLRRDIPREMFISGGGNAAPSRYGTLYFYCATARGRSATSKNSHRDITRVKPHVWRCAIKSGNFMNLIVSANLLVVKSRGAEGRRAHTACPISSKGRARRTQLYAESFTSREPRIDVNREK